jgi:hypothetical protein
MNALKSKIPIRLALGALALLAAGCGGSPPPQQVVDSLTATLSELQGLVQTLKPAESEFKDAFNGQVLDANDQVITYEESRARVDLSNGTIVRVGPLSTFILERVETRADGPFARLVVGSDRVLNFKNLKTFTCADGSGTFTLRINAQVMPCSSTDRGVWSVAGGTGAYERLRGAGTLVGSYFPNDACDAEGIDDHLTGTLVRT